ncbi:hypothetical protein B0H94_102121 [Salsuginibacillus halophilus]|uniref:GAF domain-containing protein n=1 Tax=Salsuginibacillus halophilus TaxID=517424 RepID=A0A2P8HXG2_9BACI|nr:hypothetical protein [Salsuginibacillus halophilus]PSL50845.1 hypothetical protein B0H94_102121 [Salsuginibacillus halophilus]
MDQRAVILDDIRLDIGRAYDAARSVEDFYFSIAQIFSEHCWYLEGQALYKVEENKFQQVFCYGKTHFSFKESFGEGPLSLCAVRGDLSVHYGKRSFSAILPIYDNALLKQMFVFHTVPERPVIQEDEIVLLKEVQRFIENRYAVWTS